MPDAVDVIEVETSDSDEDEDILEIIPELTSNSYFPDVKSRKRKIAEIISDSSDEDIYDKLRELSVQPLSIPAKYFKKRSRETSSDSNRTPRMAWINADNTLPKIKQITYKFNGKPRRCERIARSGVTIDGFQYKIDDAIALPHSPPLYALIRSIFTLRFNDESFPDKHLVHVHFMKRSSSHNPSVRECELMLKHGQCQDVSIKQLQRGKKLDFALVSGPSTRGDAKYYCRHVDHASQSAIRQPVTQATFDNCDSCFHRNEKHKFDDPHTDKNKLTFGGMEFHLYDFVAIDPKIKGEPYHIGQVYKWKYLESGVSVHVRKLSRFNETVKADFVGFSSNRRLLLTDDYADFAVNRIMAKVHVAPSRDDAKILDPHIAFWCTERFNGSRILDLQKSLPLCLVCHQLEHTRCQDLQACLRACKFGAADYYSGAGGFILPGLEMFNWVSATDFDKVAYQTLYNLRHKAPNLQVHYGKVSVLFDHTKSHGSADKRKSLPPPGSVFLMTGGPPCQGHSRVNPQNNASIPGGARSRDPRNDELWVMLAEVYRLRPYIVIIENVAAFKDEKGGDKGDGMNSNYARSAMKDLARNGYSSRLGLLDSRSYGSPQNRVRLFILAVKDGLPLPDFPAPTHSNPKVTATIFGNDKNGKIQPFYIGQRNTPGTALHSAVTIKDAIGDLEAFEYLPLPGVARLSRQPQIPAYNGGRSLRDGNGTRIGPGNVKYASPPQKDFQKEKRGNRGSVKDHYTSYVTDGAKKIIFEDARTSNPRGPNRRAVFSDGFSTLLTASAPGQKGTAVIHPTQDRKFTIAERKRAMGWPDWHRLAGTPLDQDRLTGNGVCYESVQAIYMSIVNTIILPWWLNAGRPTDDVFDKFKADHC
ncbi:uncharacterized protein I206_102505 [Kwoniella pini CBS 10737]|uniref:DNA (cytosine-5-)-methyltransferase n=1 Tax=Kwoniella pini CBS 10737 TaxID=1296096 RepID=A0AAJ8L3P7_9TREE